MKFGRSGALSKRTAILTVVSAAVVVVALGVGILVRTAQPTSASGPYPGAPAPTPPTHSIPSAQQLHYVSGPFISEAKAESVALGVDAGGATGPVPQVFEAKMESVAAASAELGARVAMMTVGSDRIVWVVGIKGTYRTPCPPVGACPPATNGEYNVVIDAATGQILSSGLFNAPVTGGN